MILDSVLTTLSHLTTFFVEFIFTELQFKYSKIYKYKIYSLIFCYILYVSPIYMHQTIENSHDPFEKLLPQRLILPI